MNNQDYTDIELSKPVNVDGADVTKLRMREPTVQDQIDADALKGTPAEREVALIANLCEVTPQMIKSLRLRDYKKVQDAFVGFTE